MLATVVVDDDGGGDFASIQEAIDVSAPFGNTLQITRGADRIHSEQRIFDSKHLTIVGTDGSTQVIFQTNVQREMATDCVFDIGNSATVTINNLTIRNGTANTDGGGIRNRGALTVNNSTISGNSASTDGGGIDNDGGDLTVNQSTKSGNNGSDIDNVKMWGGHRNCLDCLDCLLPLPPPCLLAFRPEIEHMGNF